MSYKYYDDLIKQIIIYSFKIDNGNISDVDFNNLHQILVDIPGDRYNYHSNKLNTPTIKDKIRKIIKYVSKKKNVQNTIFNKFRDYFINGTLKY